jgi:hypothetical protein
MAQSPSKRPVSGPLLRPYGGVYAAIAFASGSAEIAIRTAPVSQPARDIILWACVVGVIAGLAIGGKILCFPLGFSLWQPH